MEKESNYLSGIVLLCGSLLASGLYLAAFHLVPAAAWIIFCLTVILGALGAIKILNQFARSLPSPLYRAVCWLHSMAFEALAVGATFLIRPLGYILSKKKFCESVNGRPILLIHGYLHNASAWVFLKQTLCRRGLGPIYTLNLSHPFRSIRDYAALVAEKADQIAKETKRTDLALVGHSMGGLVSAWYAAKVAIPGKVADVITIGSPLAGTWAAAIAIGPNGREMRRNSEFTKTLQDEIAQSEKIRFYHIASQADQIVLPYSSALTRLHPEREYLVDDIGHMTLLFSPRVADKIEEWLV